MCRVILDPFGHVLLAAQKFVQRNFRKRVIDDVLQPCPQRADRAVAVMDTKPTVTRIAVTKRRLVNPRFKGSENIAYADLIRRARQAVAAFAAKGALDKT